MQQQHHQQQQQAEKENKIVSVDAMHALTKDLSNHIYRRRRERALC